MQAKLVSENTKLLLIVIMIVSTLQRLNIEPNK